MSRNKMKSLKSHDKLTLHGLKNVAGDTGVAIMAPPFKNDPRGHFCGQIDL